MKIKYLIWLLPTILVFSSLTFSQQSTNENVVEPDVQSPASSEVKKEEIATAALKAVSFNNGVSTFVNSKVKFELTSKDNVATDKILYKLNADNELEYKEPFAIYEEGKHLISYYAIDKVGNKEDPKSFKVIVDNTPPVVNVSVSAPVIKSGDKLYASKNFTFVVEAKDTLSGVQSVEYSIDKSNYQPYLTPFTIPADGDISLSIKAMDNVTNFTDKYTLIAKDENGNPINLADGNVSIFVDNKAPVVEIRPDKELLDKNGRKVATADYTYTISASDAESGLSSILVRLDGKGEFKTYAGTIKLDTNGDHLIEAKAVDKVGNVSPVAVLSVFVDIIAPDTTIKTIE
ncbi:MAG: OmpL47-type beta-barrel domain-containing protein [Spirochaetota bacterium]